MSNATHCDGEVMALRWDGWMEDYLYVRGHMEPSAASAALEDYHGPNGEYLRWEEPRPAWARWSVEPGPDGDGQTLRDYNEPGRGRFRVMRARVLAKHIDSHAWLTKRDGTRYDHALRRSVPRTPPEERCSCTTWNGPHCTCGNACACHWCENQWPPVAASGAGKGEQ